MTLHAHIEFAHDFAHNDDARIVGWRNNNSPIVAYTSEFRGKTNFHIREFYRDGDVFRPGKGVSIDASKADMMLELLATWHEEHFPVDPAAERAA